MFEILKGKKEEIKRKWKKLKTCISSFSLYAFPNSSPTNIFCLDVKLHIPNEISCCHEILHQTFLSGCIPCIVYKHYKFHPKVQV